MARRTGLGRGLDALIPSQGSELPASGVTQIPLDSIMPNPRQPRSRFDETEMEELATSIRQHGVIQPILVTNGSLPDRYTLIAGERRMLAARRAGLETIPAIIRGASQQDLVELALVENVQRADLGPLEAAEAYRQLSDEFGISQEEIALRVGKSRVAITNTLRLLNLPESIQQALANGQLSEGHARTLLSLPGIQAQAAALDYILRHGLNVRQTEEYVRRLTGEKPASNPKLAPPAEITALEEQLRTRLGTKVSLNRRRKGGGTLVIHFYSDEELNALTERILGEE